MMAYTHVTAGVVVGLVYAGLTAQQPGAALAMASVSGIAALLPDIDHPRGALRRKLGTVGHVGLFWLRHRGITHTVLALALVYAASAAVLPSLSPVIALGYASHLVADMMTRDGLVLFWPAVNHTLHILPRPMRVRTGGKAETSIWLVMLVIVGALTHACLR